MSDELSLLIARQLREQMKDEFQEERFELEEKPFDPVKKIASVLGRTKPVSGLRYFNENQYKEIIKDQLNDSRVRGSYEISEEGRPKPEHVMYDASTFALISYLGAGMSRNREDQYPLLKVLAHSKDSDEVIKKMSLMRIRQTLLISKHADENKDKGFTLNVEKPIHQLAHDMALALHEKHAIKLYGENFGIPKKGAIPNRAVQYPEKTEEYQSPEKGFVGLNPHTMIAANVLYSHLEGLEERLKTVSFPFGLMLLVGARVYQNMIKDEQISSDITRLLNGNKDLHESFYSTVAYYNLALLEGKLK